MAGLFSPDTFLDSDAPVPPADPDFAGGLPFSTIFTTEETAIIVDTMRAGGYATVASLVRAGLYKMAVQYDSKVPVDVFPRTRTRKAGA